MFDPVVLNDPNCPNKTCDINPDWNTLIRTRLVGIPFLISYDKGWSCSRLRYQIWLNLLRFLDPSSYMLKDAEQALCGEYPPPLVRLFQLSNQINLRLVDSKGNSLQSPVFTQQEYKQVNSSESNDKGLSMLRSIAIVKNLKISLTKENMCPPSL